MNELDQTTLDKNSATTKPQPPNQLHELIKILVALLIVIILSVTTVLLFLRSSQDSMGPAPAVVDVETGT